MPNKVWLIFSVIIFTIACWFSYGALDQLWSWWRHSIPAKAALNQWGIQRKSGSKFFLTAKTTYSVDGREYTSDVVLTDRPYRNPWAAELAIPRLEERDWTIWVDPAHPSGAILIRGFPFKSLLYAVILIGLFVYFTFVGRSNAALPGSSSRQVASDSTP